jgi:hypothetical protein
MAATQQLARTGTIALDVPPMLSTAVAKVCLLEEQNSRLQQALEGLRQLDDAEIAKCGVMLQLLQFPCKNFPAALLTGPSENPIWHLHAGHGPPFPRHCRSLMSAGSGSASMLWRQTKRQLQQRWQPCKRSGMLHSTKQPMHMPRSPSSKPSCRRLRRLHVTRYSAHQ